MAQLSGVHTWAVLPQAVLPAAWKSLEKSALHALVLDKSSVPSVCQTLFGHQSRILKSAVPKVKPVSSLFKKSTLKLTLNKTMTLRKYMLNIEDYKTQLCAQIMLTVIPAGDRKA